MDRRRPRSRQDHGARVRCGVDVTAWTTRPRPDRRRLEPVRRRRACGLRISRSSCHDGAHAAAFPSLLRQCAAFLHHPLSSSSTRSWPPPPSGGRGRSDVGWIRISPTPSHGNCSQALHGGCAAIGAHGAASVPQGRARSIVSAFWLHGSEVASGMPLNRTICFGDGDRAQLFAGVDRASSARST